MMSNNPTTYEKLAVMAVRHGEEVPCAGNLPLVIDDQSSVWFIERGGVNLFLIENKISDNKAFQQHLMYQEAGFLIPGVLPSKSQENEGTNYHILAKGLPGTMLRRLPIAILDQVEPSELAYAVDCWIQSFTDSLTRLAKYLPQLTTLVEADKQQNIVAGTFSVQKGIAWVTGLPDESSLYMGKVLLSEYGDDDGRNETLVPLTSTSWLTVFEDVQVASKSTETLIMEGKLTQALAGFHNLAFALEHLNLRLELVDSTNLERILVTSRKSVERAARKRLFNIYDLPDDREISDDSTLYDTLQVIGKFEKISFLFPKRTGPPINPVSLQDILDSSGIRSRKVSLAIDSNWWKSEGSALLAFRKEDGRPVALVPGMFGKYRMIDSITNTSVAMSAHQVALLQNEAWVFYRSFPSRNVTLVDLLSMSLHRAGGDIFRLILTGIARGLLMIFPALALGFTANAVATGGNQEALYLVSFAVVALGLLSTLLYIYQNQVLMALKDRAISSTEAAYWDRVFRLPSRVLNSLSTSGLAISGMTFHNLRTKARGAVVESILTIIFMLPVLAVIIFIDLRLGLVILAFCALALLVTIFNGIRQIGPHSRVNYSSRSTTKRLFQIIKGISKIRVGRAEGSAYSIWAKDYRDQKKAELELGNLERHSLAFNASLPFLAGATILFTIGTDYDHEIQIGDFLICYTIFLTFLSFVSQFGESFGSLAAGLPAMEQLNPVLRTETEIREEKEPVEFLLGEVLFDQISFRYEPEGPLILDDVTIHARPGEFIAIVGESGSGKSTLFNLALGSIHPTAGVMLYDGRDLRHLDLKQLRRKIGSVPQLIKLQPQDIWDNIVVNNENVTSLQLWKAARAAEIEKQIKAMPMGIFTLVGTSGSVLSGGESQRITLAKCLLGNPRVILLDEATNWLDNNSQAEIMKNLSFLTSTRIVIAHRLSTLEKADRIYVLQSGKVVQAGRFMDLRETEGVFKDMITRQIT